MAGFFKIQREYLDTSEWVNGKSFDEAKAWIDIVGRANYAEAERFYKGNYQRVHRGQLATSEVELAKRWNWSRDKVRRFLCNLTRASRITTDKTRVGTIITVVNYGIYQDKRTRSNTANDTANAQEKNIRQTSDDTHNKKNKKNKEEQEERASDDAVVSPSLEEVRLYQIETGIQVDPDAFFDYYEGQGWTRGGQPIKNWKAVFRGWKNKEVYGKKPPEVSDAIRRWLEE